MPRPHVVIIGSGFGGLFSARALAKADVDVTLISKTTAHLFQPLLYQVATGILSSGEIAPATRDILRRQKNARVLLGEVSNINLNSRIVVGEKLSKQIILRYDHLIVAAGAGQSYFGNDQFATFAPGMKSIDDALELRARIFGALEMAELSQDAAERRSLMTFVIVGAGPTGVELAGQIVELCHKTLHESFRSIDTRQCRVLLLDAAPVVLPPFGPKLSAAAHKELERIGVEVKLNAMVTNLDATGLDIKNPDGSTERIDAICKVWAAGVQASPLGKMLAAQCGIETDRAGRVPVEPDLTLPGHPEVYVIGDMMALDRLPGVAQVAIQGAKYAAKKIIGEHTGDPVSEKFSYWDKGSMAVISRFGAVAKINEKVQFSGFLAWLSWLALHLIYVVGFKNRVTTLLHWTITFLGSGRSERVTTEQQLVGRLAVKQLGPAFEPTISGILDPKKIQNRRSSLDDPLTVGRLRTPGRAPA